MKRFIKKVAILFLVLSTCMLSGCWDQMLYEEIGFILQIGLEMDDDGNFLYSLSYPVTSGDAEQKVAFMYTNQENLMRASKEELRDKAGKKLMSGKVQHIYFSKGLAQKGISGFLEIFLRNPDNPIQANVIIVEGSPKDMMALSFDYKDKARIGFYVTELMKDARDRSIAFDTRIYSFTILQYSKTIDPVLPLLAYDSEGIEIKGSALFDGDRMVGEINKDQTILLNLLTGDKKTGRYNYRELVPDELTGDIKQGAAVLILSTKQKIQVQLVEGEELQADIQLQMNIKLEEYAGKNNLENVENKKQLEGILSNAIKSDCMALLRYMQEIGADPIGLEEIVRSRNNALWKSVIWKEQYKNMQLHVKVKVNLESHGVMN